MKAADRFPEKPGRDRVEIELEGIVVIVGNYGSGKTEIAINLAADRHRAGWEVRVADLDLVNPYFRTREALTAMMRMGIDLVLPEKQYLAADLPILSPAVAGLIKNPARLTILDVGGNDAGATVLAALADAFGDRQIRMLQVINPFRPYTGTIDGCLRIRSEIENASGLLVNGIVANPNLIDETEAFHIDDGYDFACRLSEKTGLPLEFLSVSEDVFSDESAQRYICPVLKIRRQLVPPWKQAAGLGL